MSVVPKHVFVHPQALVESEDIGPGVRVWAFAHVMKGARIGANCNICDHAFIESNAILGNNVTVKNGVAVWACVRVEDDVFLGPYCVLTNDPNPRAEVKKPRDQWLPTVIRQGATIGANATVVCGVTIGQYAFVGAGAVVIRNVPDYALVVGVPGQIKGWMCRCGARLVVANGGAKCPACKRGYQQDRFGAVQASASAD